MDERAKILRAERIARHLHEGYCPDCDSPCEPWTEDGVTCGDVVGAPLTPERGLAPLAPSR